MKYILHIYIVKKLVKKNYTSLYDQQRYPASLMKKYYYVILF